jgi:hypothetical protein
MVVLIVGIAISFAALCLYDGARLQATPFTIMPLVCVVPVTLGQVLLFEGWPFTHFARPRLAGWLVLVSSHVLVFAIDRACFDFGFLRHAPFYRQALDPRGGYDAVAVTAVLITFAGSVLALAACDFDPTHSLARWRPALIHQPARGVISLILATAITALVWTLCVRLGGMEVGHYQARVGVSFIFGLFVMTVLMGGAAFARLRQPLRGLLIIGSAVIIALLGYDLYRWTWASARMAGDPALDDGEIWVSTAMLAFTFPAMAVFADLFDFWPLKRAEVAQNSKPAISS